MDKPKWTNLKIKYEVHSRGMTLTRLAEISGLNSKSFRAVWSRKHRKAEAAIANFLDIPVEELFPDRYPIRSSRILSSKYERGGASQKSADAASIRSAA
jgi:Ner family transcriptional regulator